MVKIDIEEFGRRSDNLNRDEALMLGAILGGSLSSASDLPREHQNERFKSKSMY